MFWNYKEISDSNSTLEASYVKLIQYPFLAYLHLSFIRSEYDFTSSISISSDVAATLATLPY